MPQKKISGRICRFSWGKANIFIFLSSLHFLILSLNPHLYTLIISLKYTKKFVNSSKIQILVGIKILRKAHT